MCLQAEAATFADLVEEGDDIREDPLAMVRRFVEKAEAAQQEPGSEAGPPGMSPPRVYISGNHVRSAGLRRERPPDEAAVRRRVGRRLLQPCVLQSQLLGSLGLWLDVCSFWNAGALARRGHLRRQRGLLERGELACCCPCLLGATPPVCPGNCVAPSAALTAGRAAGWLGGRGLDRRRG